MEKYKVPRILQEKTEYTMDYLESIETVKKAMSIFWTPEEIAVEKDIHQFKTELTEPEKHGIITVLKLFTLYEIVAGNEYWSSIIVKNFPRHDILRAANCFSFFEISIHAPFYNKLNEALGLATDEFYNSYINDVDLKNRMDWINRQVTLLVERDKVIINNKITNREYYVLYLTHLLKSIATFSLVEGVILYSSFAFLKHFQSLGKNKLANVVAGIDFSVKDENIHAQYGVWLYNQIKKELIDCVPKRIYNKIFHDVEQSLIETEQEIYEHESIIINKIFETGDIKGIDKDDMKMFIVHRLRNCLSELGVKGKLDVKETIIEKWFYKSINAGKLGDFFHTTQSAYNRDWNEMAFSWNPKLNDTIND
jgi:ribonucleotide reductase beta subunit family protein with ferritin-like domain